MSEWKECGKRLLEQVELLRTRIAKLLADGREQKFETEIEAMRSRLRELEIRIRNLNMTGSAMGELRHGAARAAEELKTVWRKAATRSR